MVNEKAKVRNFILLLRVKQWELCKVFEGGFYLKLGRNPCPISRPKRGSGFLLIRTQALGLRPVYASIPYTK